MKKPQKPSFWQEVRRLYLQRIPAAMGAFAVITLVVGALLCQIKEDQWKIGHLQAQVKRLQPKPVPMSWCVSINDGVWTCTDVSELLEY